MWWRRVRERVFPRKAEVRAERVLNEAVDGLSDVADYLRYDPVPPVWLELRGYSWAKLKADAFAAVMVAIVTIPQALGFALFGDALDLDPDDVDRLIRVNVTAPYHASVEAARQMPDGGRIIVIGSVNGDRMPLPGMASYALSKSALQGMARGLARDFGPRGITINIVQPGPIDTDANPEDGPMRELMHSFMAIKRHGRPEEVAGMVAWLAGPEAGFVTGAMHTIDGAFGA